LAYKAANLLQQFTGYIGGAKIELKKVIPKAMGLGGGSSDAAATLMALNQLWDLDLNSKDLHYLASNLGADVPYFLHGGTAHGTGIGNNLKALKPLKNNWLVLVCPIASIENKTRHLYESLNYESFSNGDNTRRLAASLTRNNVDHKLMVNSFDHIAFDIFTGLNIMKDYMIECGAPYVHLSGTGPSLYTFVPEKEQGIKLRDRLNPKNHKVYLLETIDTSHILTPDRYQL
jgi:4-diphosphocytidyl-2C-methyl-D-erythritol kinase